MPVWLLQILVSAFVGIIVMLLGWTAKTLLEATRTLGVHEERHKRTDSRLGDVERKVFRL